jgi:hypothetical protein
MGLQVLTPLPLEDLDISSCLLLRPGGARHGSDASCYASVAQLTRLQRLRADGLGSGDDGAALAVPSLRPLCALSRLTELSLGTTAWGRAAYADVAAWVARLGHELRAAQEAGRGSDDSSEGVNGSGGPATWQQRQGAAPGHLRLRLLPHRLAVAREACEEGVAAVATLLPGLRRLSLAGPWLFAPTGDAALAALSVLTELEVQQQQQQQQQQGAR